MNDKQRARDAASRGALAEARTLAERACRNHTRDAEAWFLLGAIHGGMGEWSDAVRCCERSVELAPDVAMTHFNLGVAQLRMGNHAAAEMSLRKAVALAPASAPAYAELGNVLQSAGKIREAVTSYRRAQEIQPQGGAVRFNLAKALSALGESDAAIAECQQAIATEPGLHEARMLLAGFLATRGDLDAASEHFRAVTEMSPSNFDAWLGLAIALRDLARTEEAETAARRACELRADSNDAHNVLGTILRSNGRLQEAEVIFREVVERDPGMAAAWNNLGIVLNELGRLTKSEIAYRTCLTNDPRLYEGYQNLSIVLREQDRWGDALATLDTWVERSGNADQARGERALVRLQLEDYARGWLEYEARWSREGMITRSFGHPVWDGSDLNGKTLLIYAEQGIGDEIMFASCFPDLIARAARVVIDCAPRLGPLFRRSFPTAMVFGTDPIASPGWVKIAPPIDLEIAAGSVPRFLRLSPPDFPAKPYLIADPERVARWRERYKTLGTGLKVGISWRGGRGVRAIQCSTQLADWRELLKCEMVHWVNLQYGVKREELDKVYQMGRTLHHWDESDPLRDLDDFAAQIAALDLVISIDNATVHLAGALGAPVWVLQPYVPDWRWGVSGKGYWYANMIPIRQERPRDWTAVFGAARGRLERALAPPPKPSTPQSRDRV